MRTLIAALILLSALAGLTACSAHRGIEAAELIGDIAARDQPSALKRRTKEPVRRTITYVVSGSHYVADIYRPGGDDKAQAAAIFVPGVVRAGKDDPRLVAFATSFARVGFLVLVPDIPSLRALAISAADARVIADAMRHLAVAGGLEGERPIGLIAFSYAAGPALIAAMESDTRHLVRFIYVVGPYYSIESVVTYFTTGHYRERAEDPWIVGQPNPYAQWVFLHSNASRLDDAQDRAALTAMADRKLADADADISDLVKGLGPQGRSVYALMTNRDPERVAELLAQLPMTIRQEMAALDLSKRDISALQGELILIHGRDDTLIPFTESLAFARATAGLAHLYVIDSLRHVEPSFSGLSDFYKLWRAAYKVLAARDAMPAPRKMQMSSAAQSASVMVKRNRIALPHSPMDSRAGPMAACGASRNKRAR